MLFLGFLFVSSCSSKLQISVVTATCKHSVCQNCRPGKEKNSLCPLCNDCISSDEKTQACATMERSSQPVLRIKGPRVLADTVKKSDKSLNSSSRRSFAKKSSSHYIQDLRTTNAKLAHFLAAEKSKYCALARKYRENNKVHAHQQAEFRTLSRGIKSGIKFLMNSVESMFEGIQILSEVNDKINRLWPESADTVTPQTSVADVNALCTSSSSTAPTVGDNRSVASQTVPPPKTNVSSPRHGTVMPMVKGQVISKPTISLRRVNVPLGLSNRNRVQLPHTRGTFVDNIVEPNRLSIVSEEVNESRQEPANSNHMPSTSSHGSTGVAFGRLGYSAAHDDTLPLSHLKKVCFKSPPKGKQNTTPPLDASRSSTDSNEYETESSSEDEGLALQIVESKKSFIERKRQLDSKEGTSWNYDDAGKYLGQPPKRKKSAKNSGCSETSSSLVQPKGIQHHEDNVPTLRDRRAKTSLEKVISPKLQKKNNLCNSQSTLSENGEAFQSPANDVMDTTNCEEMSMSFTCVTVTRLPIVLSTNQAETSPESAQQSPQLSEQQQHSGLSGEFKRSSPSEEESSLSQNMKRMGEQSSNATKAKMRSAKSQKSLEGASSSSNPSSSSDPIFPHERGPEEGNQPEMEAQSSNASKPKKRSAKPQKTSEGSHASANSSSATSDGSEHDAFIAGRDVAVNLEKTCGTVHQDRKQSQDSKLSCGPLDVIGRSPKKTVLLEAASNDIPQVDLDDDSSSSVGPDISSKRPRPLGSFSDSSYSDVVVSKKQKQKKKKIQVLSDNENSCSTHNDDADTSIVDTSKIMPNIEARLAEEERMQSAGWLNEMVNTEPVSETFEDSWDVLSNTSKNQTDSDGDSEVINPTPQKQFSFTLRQTTQSDDIVPSSQPPIPTIPSHRLVPPLLGDNHKDSIGSKPNDLPQEDLLESLGNQRNTCEDVQIVENRESSQAPVTEDASETNLFSDPVEVTETRNGEHAEDALKTTKLQFVCSSLPKNLVAQVKKLANIVKAEFSSKFTSDTSHLIVGVDENNRADKTLKYLCAVAAGKWVVSPAWVEKCLEAKKLLPEEPFEALDTTGEPGPQLSRESRLSKKNLFSGFEFCCIGEFPNISRAQMQALLIDCGASIVSKPSSFSFEERVIPVALAQWDESKEAEYKTWPGDCRAPLVHYEWVLDCIGKFSVTSFSAMLLSDVSEDYYVSMGIPSFPV
ncbi:breast cancer type 1 susceptibility protein homolog isoform X3 [Thrips palmi]|uniref:Breast cancer type 1 susceptibility protein homolog isoform X3 n=1 Tax=Thrips palmi TaxID=161013 RepID=A0A6P8Z245_THRPL|nr:breast cancer type 1 susceptibility protein homolog isoform X3 [Thrips palmi]